MALSLPLALGALGLVTIASPSPAQAAGVGFTQTSLTIPVVVGPDNKTHCNILAYLFMPADATAGHPDPAVLTTNGFGGSRDDQ
ncbi:MAG: CocE/NonD family hydrolase, partial [Acidimicrobiales bacterium]